jgi:hypothetical protein
LEVGSGDTDAIDSNGNIYVNGGELTITANSAFDYDQNGEIPEERHCKREEVTEMTNSMMGGGGSSPEAEVSLETEAE